MKSFRLTLKEELIKYQKSLKIAFSFQNGWGYCSKQQLLLLVCTWYICLPNFVKDPLPHARLEGSDSRVSVTRLWIRHCIYQTWSVEKIWSTCHSSLFQNTVSTLTYLFLTLEYQNLLPQQCHLKRNLIFNSKLLAAGEFSGILKLLQNVLPNSNNNLTKNKMFLALLCSGI